MKKFLKELVELVKDIKPETTECGGNFNIEFCKKVDDASFCICDDYYECLNNFEHRKKCDDLLNKLKVKKLSL